MKINFTKATANGNDFIIVDNRDNKLGEAISDFGDFAKFTCRRRYSIGADGVLLLENSRRADLKMRIFNPDGSEVTMCGNGARCSALYAHAKKWCGRAAKIETGAGILETGINPVRSETSNGVNGELIRIKMTPPKGIKLDQNIGVGKTIMNVHTVNTGVPHVVHFVEDIERYSVREAGRKIRYHKLFQPNGANADFVEIRDKSTILVRTYERGIEDETLACGTGVVASAVISSLVNGTEAPVNAVTKSKDILKVHFKKEQNQFRDVYLEGKAQIVFEGEVNYV